MYRADGSDNQQTIARLERELNLAYEEQHPASDDSEVGLALLRFRAHRLTRDLASFRARHHQEPLWRRLGKRVKRARLASGFVAGVAAVALAWGIHTRVATPPPSLLAVIDAEAAALDAVDQRAEPAPTLAPTTTEDVTPTPDPPAEPRVTLSVNDYKELLGRSHAFFRAVEKRDGAALAALAHPLVALSLGDEHVSFTSALLRDCFTSRHLHTVNVSAASEETAEKTCGDILAAYAETPYERAPDVAFNEVPPAPGISDSGAKAPFVFFHLPGGQDHELSWRGVQLVFERYGDELVLTAVHKAYWTP